MKFNHTSRQTLWPLFLLSLEDRFNLWYRPIFGARRQTVRLLTAISYPSGVDIVVHIFWPTYTRTSYNDFTHRSYERFSKYAFHVLITRSSMRQYDPVKTSFGASSHLSKFSEGYHPVPKLAIKCQIIRQKLLFKVNQ